jgi:transcription termination factor NusB
MATQSNPKLQREAQLNQVVDYSEFLNELARQRHTLVRRRNEVSSYEDLVELVDSGIRELDNLIRDALSHVEGSDLPITDNKPSTGHEEAQLDDPTRHN